MGREIRVSKSLDGRHWGRASSYGESTENSADDTPVVAALNGDGYIFFRRQSDKGLRYLAIDETGTRLFAQDIGSTADSGPAVTIKPGLNVGNSVMQLFYHRAGVLYYRSIYGQSIGPEQKFCDLGNGSQRGLGQPASATFLDKYYVFLRTSTGVVCHWSPVNELAVQTMMVTDITTPGRPSASVYQGALTVASFNQQRKTTDLVTFDGLDWAPPESLPRDTTLPRPSRQQGGPGIMPYRGLLRIFYSVEDGAIRYRTWDGNTSSVQTPIEYVTGSQRADYPISPFLLGGALFICYQGLAV